MTDTNVDNSIKIIPPYTSEKFWTEDITVLYKNGNYYRFYPSVNMTRIEKLNAMSRFFIYLFILFYLFNKIAEYLFYPIIGLILIVIIYYIQKNDTVDMKKESFCQNNICKEPESCVIPTRDNPFMNVNVNDYTDRPNRPDACNPLDKTISNEINSNYNHNLMSDADDLYQRGHSQRQFYTTPNTQLANKQTELAEWLYRLPTTCKEDTRFCMRNNYEDLRYKRYNPNIDTLDRAFNEE